MTPYTFDNARLVPRNVSVSQLVVRKQQKDSKFLLVLF
jgi:hypothetical protein